MTTCINVFINNAANSLHGIWPHTPTVRESEIAASHALLPEDFCVSRSESAKLNALESLGKAFVRVCRRWFMSKREEVHHGRSH